MSFRIFDPTPCLHGEGPLWHPERQMLFWFDIIGKTLHWRGDTDSGSMTFDEYVSAAGWIDTDTLLVASATGLWCVDLRHLKRELVCHLEHDNPITRSNDGRADPYGGFWIGTMGLNAESGAGAFYRYYRGELRKVYDAITITNSLCFAPDASAVYYCDTQTGVILRQALNSKQGWPMGEPEVYVDLSAETFGVDGSVIDARGTLWNAQWGASRVAGYDPTGHLTEVFTFPTRHISCPAFGGPDLSILFVTSSRQGMSDADLQNEPLAGQTFMLETPFTGQAEHRVIL